ncbi:MAG TPA: glycosyltransferase family 2 protein [Nitrososphaerales archaeon]|nr:glycosyltransferase family 2 protein [Nitrososphaerales archaeon]
MSFTVSIVIATKDSAKTIGMCLNSLMPFFNAETLENIIVVDDGSRDGTEAIVASYPARLVAGQRSTFFAAYELGWRNASGDLIVFLDSDAFLKIDFLPHILSYFEKDSNLGILGVTAEPIAASRVGKLIGQWWDYRYENLVTSLQRKKRISWWGRLYLRYTGSGESQVTVQGPCYVIRREALVSMDGLPKLGDDLILSRLLTSKGWKSAWCLHRLVSHFSRSRLSSAALKYVRYGLMWGLITKPQDSFVTRLARAGTRAFSPIIAAKIAVKYRSPLHFFLYIMLAGLADWVGHMIALFENDEFITVPTG